MFLLSTKLHKFVIMYVLGISAFFHDSAAALVSNGVVICAAQEERFTKQKHTSDFPIHAIQFCLDHVGIKGSELDAIVFYDKPFLKFERILESIYQVAPFQPKFFLKAIPSWMDKKLFLKKEIRKQMRSLDPKFPKNKKILWSSHHLSHAASAFYPSPYTKAAILTIDGVGEWATASIAIGNENNIEVLKEMNFPHSIGLLYSAFTYFLGFKINNGEYKLMGLAPYGNPKNEQTIRFLEIIKTTLVKIHKDGSVHLNMDYFEFVGSLRTINDQKWKNLFGICRRLPNSEIENGHCNLAYAIQKVTEEIVLAMAVEAKRITGSENLCLAGGVALNCVSNGVIHRAKIFNSIWIQPAAGDAGGALGAALAASHLYLETPKEVVKKTEPFNCFLGPSFSTADYKKISTCSNYTSLSFDTNKETAQYVAKLIHENKIIGWFQGAMEFGPRALGNRSILANPSSKEMQRKINLAVKKREDFRPFAPVMLKSEAQKYFDFQGESPYMLLTQKIKSQYRKELPTNYRDLPLKKQLETPRTSFQAATHVDFSARLQTIDSENHPLWNVLQSYKTLTGDGILLNTSFNTLGKPIVCSPKDAYECFIETEIDILVLGNNIIMK